MCDGPDLFLCILAVLFPPIGVWVKRGICSADGLINIALCCLGYLPGLLHSWYIISSYPAPDYEPVVQEEGVIYYVHAAPAENQGYGTVTPHGQFPGQHQGTGTAFPHSQQPNKQAKMSAAPPRAPSRPRGEGESSAPPQTHPAAGAGEAAAHSSSDAPPPSYADAVKLDNKIQD